MVELSRDVKRVYFTNSLYTPGDAQFYPDGTKGWLVKFDAQDSGGMSFDEASSSTFRALAHGPTRFTSMAVTRVSSDSYCYS